MIFKKQPEQSAKKVNPFLGFLLFLISILLLVLTGPIGFLYGCCHGLLTRSITGIGEYLLKVSISIDQLGNVLMQHLLNALWVKEGGYLFGNRDETMSSALGKNKTQQTLTGFGRLIDSIFEFIDPNHSLNSIDYFVEPVNENA